MPDALRAGGAIMSAVRLLCVIRGCLQSGKANTHVFTVADAVLANPGTHSACRLQTESDLTCYALDSPEGALKSMSYCPCPTTLSVTTHIDLKPSLSLGTLLVCPMQLEKPHWTEQSCAELHAQRHIQCTPTGVDMKVNGACTCTPLTLS